MVAISSLLQVEREDAAWDTAISGHLLGREEDAVLTTIVSSRLQTGGARGNVFATSGHLLGRKEEAVLITGVSSHSQTGREMQSRRSRRFWPLAAQGGGCRADNQHL